MLNGMKIGTRLILVGTVLLVVPLAVVAVLAVERSTAALTALESEQLGRGARLVATGLDAVVREEMKLAAAGALERDVVAAAADPSDGKAVAGAAARLAGLEARKGIGEGYDAIMVLDAGGRSIAASDASYLGVDFSDRAYVKAALAGTVNAGDAVISKVSSRR